MPSKKEDLRNMTKDELGLKLSTIKNELYNLRYQARASRIEKPHKIQEAKREIARINTILREGELNNAGKPRKA